MRFDEFLTTKINEQLPITKLKNDLSYFKNTFNYASKTDELYSNLIDNIVFILQRKFGRFSIIYKDVEIMYSELLLTLSPQLPQFLMIQKKQLLESLDTFGDLNNWGDILKDNIKRDLNLSSTGENTTNYVPLDGNEKDAYSSNDVTSTETHGENTSVSRNTSNYLAFYNNIRWNIADLELEKILKPYYKMFKLYYGDDYAFVQSPSANTLEKRVTQLEENELLIGDAIDKNFKMITNNADNIFNNSQDISKLQGDKADKTQLNNYYTKSQSDAKFGLKSVQDTNTQNITNLENTKANKNDVYTKQESDDKFVDFTYLSTNYYNKSDIDVNHYTKSQTYSQTEANSRFGKLEFANTWRQANTFTNDLNINGENALLNLTIGTGTNNKSLVNKEYVVNNFLGKGDVPVLTNYYTKQESDDKFGLKSVQETNSTNIVNLNNTKADKTSVYTKSESDGRYAQLSGSNLFTGANKFNFLTVFNKGIAMNGSSITNVANPTNPQDAANKQYVDNIVKYFDYDLSKCRWVDGGSLGGRWDRYNVPFMNISPLREWSKVFKIGVIKYVQYSPIDSFILPLYNSGYFVIKDFTTDTNLDKSSWVLRFYYI